MADVASMSFVAIGRKYGVSDSAVGSGSVVRVPRQERDAREEVMPDDRPREPLLHRARVRRAPKRGAP